MTITVGSLCTGTSQLERALALAGLDTELAFVADPDPAAVTLLAHHHPNVPNLGDITRTDWTRIEPVIALCAGWPCQPWSLAGKRKGADDERAIWPAIADAVRDLRPRYVFLENVPNIVAAGELARAVGDLASLGYVGSWRCVRASDVGAAHRRDRAFILAWQEGDSPAGLGVAAAGTAGGRGGDGAVLTLLKTPTAQLAINGGSQHPDKRKEGGHGPTLADQVEHLLPTPTVQNSHGNTRNNRGDLLLPGVVQLLPTPQASDGDKGGPNQRGSSDDLMLSSAVQPERWGQFATAIARWEAVIGRPAPDPTEPGRTGMRLSPRFVEWLMGLPAGWVTEVPGLSRNQQLHLLGNGVVAHQGAHALRLLVGHCGQHQEQP